VASRKQTERESPRPLQADGWANSLLPCPFYEEIYAAEDRYKQYKEFKRDNWQLPHLDIGERVLHEHSGRLLQA
jgi:hypothetical protein